MTIADSITEFFRPMMGKVQEKFAEKYWVTFARKIDKIDGLDIGINVTVDVYPNKEAGADKVSYRYTHEFFSREFVSKSFRERLKKGLDDERS